MTTTLATPDVSTGGAVAAPSPRRANRIRALSLPIAAASVLATGGLFWLWSWLASAPGVQLIGTRIWYAGLIVTGAPVVWTTLRGVLRGHFASDLVATLSVIGAVILGEPIAGLVIVLMQSGGEALERLAEGRASAAVRELEAAAPRTAHRLRDGRIDDVPVESVVVDDVLLVRPGELVPCDAIVVSGRSAVDASRINGEPLPIDAVTGTALSSGSANGDAPLTVRVTAVARESQYARIVELVRSAQASKAPLQRLADRYAIWFTPATLIVCAIAWYWSGDARRALAVLVVATPCPLILATPIAIIGGINRAARRQIIIRNGGALEQLSATTTAIFDKTGTLTIGKPEVRHVTCLNAWTERELLRFAGAVENGATHLLARTFVAAAERALASDDERLPVATEVSEVAGRGVTGLVGGHRVTVGAWSYLLEQYPETAIELDELDRQYAEEPGLRAYIGIDGRIAGVVEYADRVRDDARNVMTELTHLGINRLMLLSGDHTVNVRSIAAEVGIPDARADLSPSAKERIVSELVASGTRVLMVGDGINDAPALSSATVGIALASHGGGISAEAADIVLLADHLSRVPEAMRISRRTMRVARQSIVAGIGLSAVAMLVAALGGLSPTLGAVLQEGIDVAVIVNALRTSR